MPTLLQINTSLNSGSTGRIAEGIGLCAEANGWDCYVAHGARYQNPSRLKSVHVGRPIDEFIHGGCRSLLLDEHGLGSMRATNRFIQTIDREIKPDIIHLHNIHGYYLNYRILFEYLQRTQIPVVWTLHDCWPFTGHCVYFELAGCEKWKTQCADCPQLATYPRSLFRDHSRQNFELKKALFTSLGERLTLVPVSYWLEAILKQSFFGNCRIQTIHNGIDIQAFSPCESLGLRQRYSPDGKFIVLGVASPWSERKGLSDFVRLRNLLPAKEYEIVLIGVSESQQKNLPEGIIGIRRTQNVQELATWYSAADVFVNLTYEDNYPTVNLEAMACGTPVITYRTGGSPEAVTPETGLVVEQGAIDDVANAIFTIRQDGNLAIYHNSCRARAQRHFDKQECFQQYIELYQKVLNNK